MRRTPDRPSLSSPTVSIARRLAPGLCASLVLIGSLGIAFAGASQDLRIRSERDAKRNTVYLLTNGGSQIVHARVETDKQCSGVSNRKAPKVEEYWVRPGESVELRKVWAQSTCEYRLRVVDAEYYEQPKRRGRTP